MDNEIIYITDYTEWTKGQCKKCKGINIGTHTIVQTTIYVMIVYHQLECIMI